MSLVQVKICRIFRHFYRQRPTGIMPILKHCISKWPAAGALPLVPLNDVNVVRVYWANALEPAVATNSENSVEPQST